VKASQPAAPAAQPAAPAAAPAQPGSPFRMPSFAAKPPSAAPAQPSTAGAGLFQKGATSSPFGRPRAATAVPRMPTFGRDVAKPAADNDDEIELRPYVPKKK
jgi:hypothetical protein